LRADPPAIVFVDTRTGRVTTAQGPDATGSVLSIRFSPDNRTVVTTEGDNVILWDSTTGRELETLVGHGGVTNSADFTPDGRTLYSSSLDGAVFSWDLGGARRFGRPLRLPSQPRELPHVPQTPPLAVSPDSTRFAVRRGASAVVIYSLRTFVPERTLAVRGAGVITTLAWSPGGSSLAVGSRSGPVQLWTLGRHPQRLHQLQGLGPAQAIAFSPDGQTVAAVDDGRGASATTGSAELWSTVTGRMAARVRLSGRGTSVAFSPNGRRLAVGLDTGHVLVVDAGSGQIAHALAPIGLPNVSVTFAPDGSLLTGSYSGIVQRWDVDSGREVGEPVRVAPGPVASISFGSNPALFATSSLTEGAVRLWQLPSLQQFGGTLPGDTFALTHAAITPDGTRLVVVFDDGHGYVWPLSLDGW
jgi:WD40 repeat protein